MDFRVLQYFLTVAKEENITKAAELLHVTQPTLSRQMMQLEEELGVSLFERKSHSIRLTEQGVLFCRRAGELLSLAEKAKTELKEEAELEGELLIGSGEYRNSRFLAELLSEFHTLYPEVRYEIYTGNSDDIKERIERGLLDLGFLLEPVDLSKYEFLRSPYPEEWGVLVPETSELAAKEAVTPEDLHDLPLLVSGRELVQKEIRSWFGSYADELKIVASGNLTYNRMELARQKMGVSVGIQLNCQYDGMKYVPLSPRLESRTLLAWKKNEVMSPLLRTFLDFSEKYIKCISKDKK